jgi:hypothetical protein
MRKLSKAIVMLTFAVLILSVPAHAGGASGSYAKEVPWYQSAWSWTCTVASGIYTAVAEHTAAGYCF